MDIPRENVFAALVLGGGLGVSDVANIQETRTRSGGFDRNVDLNEDDVFSLLALSGRGGSADDFFESSSDMDDFDSFGSSGSSGSSGISGMSRDLDFADMRNDRTDTRVVSQRVTVDRDDLLFSLALRNGGGSSGSSDFGSSDFGDSSFGDSGFGSGGSSDDFESIADIDRTVRETRTSNRDMNLDDEDVLLSLALR